MKRIVAILLVINTLLFIISLVLLFTLLLRPFYYWHIKSLDLEVKTGYKYDEIKEAYDDVIDYLVLNKSFSTGKFKYSDAGMDHFKDCKTLFTINFVILGITSIIIIIKKKYFNDIKLLKFNISFWSSILLLTMFLLILIITLILGFDKIYTIFHNIFFLGKTNWLFDYQKDEIIRILPQRFFMNCGIMIVSLISLISIGVISKEIFLKKRNNDIIKL